VALVSSETVNGTITVNGICHAILDVHSPAMSDAPWVMATSVVPTTTAVLSALRMTRPSRKSLSQIRVCMFNNLVNSSLEPESKLTGNHCYLCSLRQGFWVGSPCSRSVRFNRNEKGA